MIENTRLFFSQIIHISTCALHIFSTFFSPIVFRFCKTFRIYKKSGACAQFFHLFFCCFLTIQNGIKNRFVQKKKTFAQFPHVLLLLPLLHPIYYRKIAVNIFIKQIKQKGITCFTGADKFHEGCF